MYGNYLNLYSIFKLVILYIFFVRNYWTNSEYIKHPEFLNQTYSGYKKNSKQILDEKDKLTL